MSNRRKNPTGGLPPPDPDDLLARTLSEIDRLCAEHARAMPRELAKLLGAAYARFSSIKQDSVPDQIREILKAAADRGIHVPREHIYFDLGVRGCVARRPGLLALRAAVDAGQVQAALFFATSRLFRKAHQSLRFVEELHETGVRGVFVRSGVDTDNKDQWRHMLQINALVDELGVRATGGHVLAGQLGRFDRRQVWAFLPIGYTGRATGETGRNGRPTRDVVVDPAGAAVVERIFDEFVGQGKPIAGIARDLNADPAVPRPPGAKGWAANSVRTVLGNPKYRGWFELGVTESVWMSTKDYAVRKRRPEPLRAEQVEEWRIVSDKVWYLAAERLEAQAKRVAGRRPADPDRTAGLRVLSGLCQCPAHDRALLSFGSYGDYLVCPACHRLPRADRPLFTHLNRRHALARVCEAVAARLLAAPALVARLLAACRAELVARATGPDRTPELTARITHLDRRIRALLDNLGDTPEDQAETEAVLRRLRAEREAARRELAALAAGPPADPPDEAAVAALLGRLHEALVSGAGKADRVEAVRAVIDLVTGGSIVLEQAGDRRPHRGRLVGRFRCHLAAAVAGELVGGRADPGEEVVIDFGPDDDHPLAGREAELVARSEEGWSLDRMAAWYGVSKYFIDTGLDRGYAALGRERPDARHRPRILERPTRRQQFADRVKEQVDRGVSLAQIARDLGISKTLAHDAWLHWYKSRDLTPPSRRPRSSGDAAA